MIVYEPSLGMERIPRLDEGVCVRRKYQSTTGSCLRPEADEVAT